MQNTEHYELTDMNELYNLPHNLVRKAFALKHCILELEALQRRYAPIFNEDPDVNSLLKQTRGKYEAVMAVLRDCEDASVLLSFDEQ